MSSYDCVIPVSWERLVESLLPEWCKIFSDSGNVQEFCQTFAADAMEYLESGSSHWRVLPKGYLEDIGWSGCTLGFPADNLRHSVLHQAVAKTIGDTGTVLLCRAIRGWACAELSGSDPFANTPWNGFYSRLGDRPTVQVAGTKTQYRFLEGRFTLSYDSERMLYGYNRREKNSDKLDELLEKLFLATRAFPGILVLPENNSWPAYDDLWMQGYLMPSEVSQLVTYLDLIAESCEEHGFDDLFPLFADRVRRAAISGYGLITLHAGL
jgi:hypothetical protein